jgi:hypothetical protein
MVISGQPASESGLMLIHPAVCVYHPRLQAHHLLFRMIASIVHSALLSFLAAQGHPRQSHCVLRDSDTSKVAKNAKTSLKLKLDIDELEHKKGRQVSHDLCIYNKPS